ncbi:MAG: tetratricopeptide repeat protein [Gammaproteobacteria bacterium]
MLAWALSLLFAGPACGAARVMDSADPDTGFTGARACAECHEAEFTAWRGSHHDLAMDHATADTVLGDFDGAEVTASGVTSRFFVRDGRYFVNTDGPDGALRDFEITHTFGVAPLQQYLVPFPGGRLQALPLAWDTRPAEAGGQRWFHVYPGETITHDDELHWTGLQQNWNYMCADCHSTNLVKGYDPASATFDTTWSEIDVACEACHGPGAEHVAWAGLDEAQRGADSTYGLDVLLRDRGGVAWVMDQDSGIAQRSEPRATDTEIQVCATCHSRRGTLAPGAATEASFLDHHMPALLTADLYHDDGQIDDEVYVWGSFLQSRMHAAGVTCSDCHDPHSQQLRAPGDAVCAQCHLATKYAVTDHHGHPPGSTGASCLACHMPEKTYMVVDPRRDHSLRSPRPDLALEFGTPDACSDCHADQTLEWSAEAFARMFPHAGDPFQDWTRAFRQARDGLPQAEVSLLRVLNDRETPDIARATAVLELQPYLSPLSGQAVEAALRDPSPLVRIAALRVLDAVPPANRLALAGHLLRDPLLAVRSEAGRMLATTPPAQLDPDTRQALQSALRDYYGTQQFNADRPESRLNLGNLQAQSGNAVEAEKYYRQALALDDGFTPAYLNLADLYRAQGMEDEARTVLRRGLERLPNAAALHFSLGLSLVRSQETDAALAALRRAVELDPGSARYAYVYGVGLNSTGRTAEAVEALQRGHRAHPNDRNLLMALATMERDRGRVAQAMKWAEKMLTLNPGDPAANQLMEALRSAQQAPPNGGS